MTQIVRDYGSVALTSGVQTLPDVLAPVFGDVILIRVSVTASAAGTLTSAKLSAGIASFQILDAGNNPILSIVGYPDFNNISYLLDPRGFAVTESTISTSSQTNTFILNLPISVADQPIRFKASLAPLSVFASGASPSANVQLQIAVTWSDDMLSAPASARPSTLRLNEYQLQTINGVNDYSSILAQNVKTVGIAFYTSPESNYSAFTLRGTGKAELENVTLAETIALDQFAFLSGHVAGLINTRVSPFVTNSATKLQITTSAAQSLTLYQFWT